MNGYKDLRVWQKGLEISCLAIGMAGRLPNQLRFTLGDQIQRSAISIPSNLAEGYGRNNLKELRRFSYIALGSAMELETQLMILEKIGIEERIAIKHLTTELDILLRMLNKYIQTMKVL